MIYSAEFRRSSGRVAAFTLTELLTVIAIIGVLAAILIPVTMRMREGAQKATCMSNLRQLGLAIGNYTADNRGNLPHHTGQAGDVSNKTLWQNIYPHLGNAAGKAREGDVYTCPSNLDPNSPRNPCYIINLNVIVRLPGSSEGKTGDRPVLRTRITKRRIMLADLAKKPRHLYSYYGSVAKEQSQIAYEGVTVPENLHVHGTGVNALWTDFSVTWMSQSEIQKPNAQIPGGTYFGRAWDGN